MSNRQIISICDRHGVPAKYRIHFCNLVQHGQITMAKFGRLTRRNLKFKTCLEEMLDVLSEPFKLHFEPTHFESLTQEKVTA